MATRLCIARRCARRGFKRERLHPLIIAHSGGRKGEAIVDSFPTVRLEWCGVVRECFNVKMPLAS